MVNRQTFPKVSVVILTYNRREADVVECVNSAKSMVYPNYEIILVDNSSKSPSKYIEAFDNVSVIDATSQENMGASRGRNLGIKHAGGDYIFFVDDDVVLDKKCLGELVYAMENDSSIGLAGALMYVYNNPTKIWFYNQVFLSAPKAGTIDVRMIVGGAMLVKRGTLNRIGGFDPIYFFYAEDWDFSYRIQIAGFRTVCALNASCWHKVANESAKLFSPRRAYYFHRNYFVFAGRHRKTINHPPVFLFKNLIYSSPRVIPSYFVLSSLKEKRLDALKSYLHGILDGIVIFAKLSSAED